MTEQTNTTNTGCAPFTGTVLILTFVGLLLLKVSGRLHISWLVVFLPLIVDGALMGVMLLMLVLVAILTALGLKTRG